MTLCICQNAKQNNCIAYRVTFIEYKFKKINQAVRGANDEIQVVTNESNCTTNICHNITEAGSEEELA